MLDPIELRDQIKTVTSEDAAARRQTLHALRNYKEADWAAAPLELTRTLVKALQQQLTTRSDQASIRQEIATILGNIGPRAEAAVPQLVELLKEGVSESVREAAATALGKIGAAAASAVQPLIDLLSGDRVSLHLQVVRALCAIGCTDAKMRHALLKLWNSDKHPKNVQVQIAYALCKLKLDSPDVIKMLTSVLMTEPAPTSRVIAAEALAWCDRHEAEIAPVLLLSALNDKSEEVQAKSEASLAQLGLSHEKVFQHCIKQLKESPCAETALRNGGQAAVPALIEALHTKQSLIREKAAKILGSFGELASAAVPALTAALHDKEPYTCLAAAKALWNITKDADVVVPVLVELLEKNLPSPTAADDARRQYQQTVIEALWRIGPPAKLAVPALTAKTKDKNRLVSESAKSALRGIVPAVATKGPAR